MSNTWWRLSVVLLILGLMPGMSQQAALAESDFYTAGVVEFQQSIFSLSAWSDSLAGYVEIINSENANATDIIVFPESTLNSAGSTTFVPNPEDQINPCLSDPNATYYEEFLVTLSCAARNASKYIVINLTEKQKCEDVPEDTRPCASNGLNVFNTNVVFDRQGVVVSRYRKVHLYGEAKNSTLLPELSTFETDFGVTFGHFICFDILFYTPAHQLILEQGITDFVYPAMWFSQLPFLTAVQTQQGWAYANDVNLLASGASRPSIGNSGSGIYHGRSGTLTSVMRQDSGERAIYVAQVPKYTRSRSQQKRVRRSPQEIKPRQVASSSSFYMKRDYVENYESELLKLDEGTSGAINRTICQGSFCCNFDLAWRSLGTAAENGSYYSYRLGTYDGWRNENNVDANYIRNCALFTCSGDSIDDCGKLLPTEGELQQSRVTFTRLAIGVTYPESREFLLFPDTLLDSLLPLEPSQFEWSQRKTTEDSYVQEVRFALKESQELSNLLTFGIYGNYYDNECTFGVGTEEEQQDCGYRSGSAGLRILGGWLTMPLIILAIARTMSS
ncbi:vanin-like protein 1 [Drosophila sechellia]|uniref:GM12589 n=1 Tax=Drosophila sechellia TaxID=7238 RepID=B4I0E3_DROSE|nr:vanin-like protein 1 [Drosophila sechellia]EDW52974.1 GM12589 [Drosophila sechellia]